MSHPTPRLPRRGPVARRAFLAVLALPALLVVDAAPLAPQESPDEALRLITPDDYDAFESLGPTTLSPDAGWLAAVVRTTGGESEVRLHRTDGDSTIVVPGGSSARFTADARWAGVTVTPNEDERRRLREQDRPPRDDLVLVDLQAGETEERSEVASWSFSEDGAFLLIRRYGAGGNGGPRGIDIVVRELETGVDLNFGSVAEALWHDERPLLAMVIDAEGSAGNGVRLYDAASGTLRTVHSEEARFSGMAWRDDASDLAVFREDVDEERGDTLRTVLAWRDVDEPQPAAMTLEGAFESEEGEHRITNFRGLRWSENGDRIFVGAVPRDPPDEEEAPVAEPDEAEGEEGEEEDSGGSDDSDDGNGEGRARGGPPPQDSVPGVEIWHARDVDPVPQQARRANQVRRASDLVAWEPDAGRTVVLGGREGDTSVSLLEGEEDALFLDGRAYSNERMFGPVYRDAAFIDVATGEREPALERVEYFMGASPGGRYALYFSDDQWHAYDRVDGVSRDLTSDLDGTFVNEQHDHTVEQRRPHGSGGWMEGDEAVLLYDRYDVWRVAPDGSGGERLTRGAEEEIRHRALRLDFDEPAFDPDEPIYLSLYGQWTKDAGYGRLHPDGEVERLVYEPRSISSLSWDDDAEAFTFRTQRYDEPPAVYVAGPDLDDARRVTGVNEHVADSFMWGRSELVDYENEWGERLQAALFYPADYEPGRQYPMIVYPYEMRSQVLHSWSNPSERSAYNTTVFTQNGYFVLQPDVVYRPRNPGLSFMEAINPALDAAIATGMIDPDRIGLTGHSWGGYQTTFAVTQTDRFAAAVAGAPLTNLMSMYLSFYWNSGGTDARIFELSQGRMEVPWWEDFESYRANSPVHHIQNMDTPLLMAFGTEDGAVEFNQGVEFYNAARRTGKDFVLLVYEGENHSLAQRPNQIDYHRRSLEWFDHYLKGAEAPTWITEGIPYLEQEEKLERGPAAGRVPGRR